MTENHVEEEELFNVEEKNSNAGYLELIVGGDYGKGSHTLIASTIVRFLNDRETEILDL